MLRCPQKIRDEKYSIRVKNKMLHLFLIQIPGGLVGKIEDFHAGDQSSNPCWVFCTFFTFFQTLRANCGFQRTRAIYRLFLSLKGGRDYPNKWSKSTFYCIFYLSVWYEKITNFRSKNGRFLPFSQS